MNKEAGLAFDRPLIELGRENQTECWDKKGGVGRHHLAARGERCELLARTLPVGHKPVVKYKIMETG